jgi:hypothetical protein
VSSLGPFGGSRPGDVRQIKLDSAWSANTKDVEDIEDVEGGLRCSPSVEWAGM